MDVQLIGGPHDGYVAKNFRGHSLCFPKTPPNDLVGNNMAPSDVPETWGNDTYELRRLWHHGRKVERLVYVGLIKAHEASQ